MLHPPAHIGGGDSDKHAFRKVTMVGAVSTLAGNRETGFVDGTEMVL